MEFTLVVLILSLSTPAVAERLQQRVAQGNNVGLGLVATWCTPMIMAPWSENTLEFPRGSGNFIFNDGWTFGLATTRDFDGDGVPEDTIVLGGGRDNMPYLCSIESYEVIASVAAVDTNMEWSMQQPEYNRIWTSLDTDELAEWPIEARNPRTASGKPVIHGAETMFLHSGDVFNSWFGPTNGFYMGWSFYFLNWAESSDMVYGHVYLQNVSEYMKWNPTPGYAAIGQQFPDGWIWQSMVLFHNERQIRYAGYGDMGTWLGWAYHPAKEIVVQYSTEPTIESFTPPEPPLLGVSMLKTPRLRDEEMVMTNLFNTSNGEFGFAGTGINQTSGNLLDQIVLNNLSHGQVYRAALAQEDIWEGQINPFSEKTIYGWPGVLTPEDARYNKWLWGGNYSWDTYTFWGELHEVAPRDTMSFDFVIMFTPTGVTPLEVPAFDLANIDDLGMQAAFAPQEDYADVALITLESGFATPETPKPPRLILIPGDEQVTITWSDINVNTPDPYYNYLEDNNLNPMGYYREYDFEGYRLYRSLVMSS